MMRSIHRPSGMSLLEVVAAVVIASMLAVAGFSLMRDQSEVAHERICEGHRTALQSDAELYQRETGRWPGGTLAELATSDYTGTILPRCPMAPQGTTSNYRLVRERVVCQFHP
ncbi:PulJ/GspJ family protein [Neorhodopirellula pilleata]|uniref:Type II secretion system protein G n=1 Tax=Neorhodopirellula pilleata TaxID=2714738 RepID=A0A5C5ZIR0_9BACT|nr:type II secretion system protein [Neorhodopirellula pilleata]TWT87040.1 hypothetical protein Pla100_59910 [Neorhodopirellula pilleata]